eukprot:SAG31_NODE_308_length_17951_cov_4.779240_10_plen_86_part_00
MSNDPSAVVQVSPRADRAWKEDRRGRRHRGGVDRSAPEKEVVCSCGMGGGWKRGLLCGSCVLILIGGLVTTIVLVVQSIISTDLA